MRARNIKPGVFENEILGSADPIISLLFAGLWCMADRDGRLEDRPLRIRGTVFPYRAEVNVDSLLTWLHEKGFITRYHANGEPTVDSPSNDGERYIQIKNWSKHQKPHHSEKASVIPALGKTCKKDSEPTVDSPSNDGRNRPDSGLSDSGLSDSGLSDSGLSDSGFDGNGHSQNSTSPLAAPSPTACRIAEKFQFVCKRRRPSGEPMYHPSGLTALASQIDETIRQGVSASALESEVSRSARNKNEWYGDMENRLLSATGNKQADLHSGLRDWCAGQDPNELHPGDPRAKK